MFPMVLTISGRLPAKIDLKLNQSIIKLLIKIT